MSTRTCLAFALALAASARAFAAEPAAAATDTEWTTPPDSSVHTGLQLEADPLGYLTTPLAPTPLRVGVHFGRSSLLLGMNLGLAVAGGNTAVGAAGTTLAYQFYFRSLSSGTASPYLQVALLAASIAATTQSGSTSTSASQVLVGAQAMFGVEYLLSPHFGVNAALGVRGATVGTNVDPSQNLAVQTFGLAFSGGVVIHL